MPAGGTCASAWRRLVTNNIKRGDFSIFISFTGFTTTSDSFSSKTVEVGTFLGDIKLLSFLYDIFLGVEVIYPFYEIKLENGNEATQSIGSHNSFPVLNKRSGLAQIRIIKRSRNIGEG